MSQSFCSLLGHGEGRPWPLALRGGFGEEVPAQGLTRSAATGYTSPCMAARPCCPHGHGDFSSQIE